MICFRYISSFLHDWSLILLLSARDFLLSRRVLILEKIALRKLALFHQQIIANKCPKPGIPAVTGALIEVLDQRESVLMAVKPEAVIRWHLTAFRWYWNRRFRPRVRPAVSRSLAESRTGWTIHTVMSCRLLSIPRYQFRRTRTGIA